MKKRSLAVVLCLLLAVAMLPAEGLAKVKSAGTPTTVTTLCSSEKLTHNFVQVQAADDHLEITCETPIRADRFSVNVRRVQPSSGSSQWICYVYPEMQDDYYRFTATVPASALMDGSYVLVITMPTAAAGKKSDVFYKNCNFRVKNGHVSILQYDKILAENARMEKQGDQVKPTKFKAKNLSDIRSLVCKDPVTGKVAKMTTKKVKYFKKVSDAVTKGVETDYEKVLKIYEYIGEKFYYDDIAFSTKTKQYVDPYRNLYNLRNKKSSANSKNGKIATVCVGYGAAVVALCRAQGIPARIVNGHHVGMTSAKYNNWSTEKHLTTVDHWWAEVYVDGEWITVDPTPANGNRWNRSTGKWTYTGLTNYIYFDPTPEQLATSHVILEIRGV